MKIKTSSITIEFNIGEAQLFRDYFGAMNSQLIMEQINCTDDEADTLLSLYTILTDA